MNTTRVAAIMPQLGMTPAVPAPLKAYEERSSAVRSAVNDVVFAV
jgi:hypothetical protein